MNWADYCIIAALGLSVLMGLWRGFIGEAIALACWVLAFWVAWTFGAQLAAQFTAITLPSARLVLGYAICFVGVLIAGALVGFLMRKLIAGSGLSGSDRMLGMVFGLIRGLAIVTITVLILKFTPLPQDPWWKESKLLPTFENAAKWLSTKLPPDVTHYLDLHTIVPQIPQAPPNPPPAPTPPPQSPAQPTSST
ncbi:MAG TPA: CvpA family protein [Rudaea sp.]|nr:CvpA family protein [Rudaea sp.]